MPAQLTVIAALSAIGILDTAFLSYHSWHKRPVPCPLFPDEWCHKVQFSPYSRMFFGIPNSYLGFAMFAALFILALTSKAPGPVAWPVAWPVTALVAAGFAMSLYFTYVQAFVLKAFCTWCVISALCFTGMALALLIR